MGNVELKNILDASFRATPDYQLVLFDRLDPAQQDTLRDLTKDPDFYGVLIPSETGSHTTKSVCRDTALLLFTLQQPGRLPAYVRASLGENCNEEIAQLVLDGVLQMERDGRFISGAEAYDLIYHERSPAESSGVIGRLTQAALEYAQTLDIDDSAKLSARLYFYNRWPLTRQWKCRFPSQEAVAIDLGIQDGGANSRLLEKRWSRRKPSSLPDGWFQWECRTDRATDGEIRQVYKLYVSPRPAFVPEAFHAVADILSRFPAHHFKVGYDAAGLLRPDKIVIYFWTFEELQETAHQIALRLAGCAAQGVPFTAALGSDGLLSWGIDPAAGKGTLAWLERESWRLWVTNRLATALATAKRAPGSPGVEPWRFALQRLRLENVDTDTWTPLAEFGRGS